MVTPTEMRIFREAQEGKESSQAFVPMIMHNRTYTLASMYGHRVHFPRGKVVNVPLICYEEAIALGAGRADGKEPDDPEVLPDVQESPKPIDPNARKDYLMAACEELAKLNSPDDFTASGAPKVEAVKRVTPELFDANRKEVSAAWGTYQELLHEIREAKKAEARLAKEEAEADDAG